MTDTTPRTLGMRDAFFEALFPLFKADPRCVLISADNGAPSLDRFVQELPDQFIQVGIAEQQMVGMAAGLAIEGHRVWTYAIAPFVSVRCLEQVKLDICAHRANVCQVGVGAGFAYDVMGPSHHCVDDIALMRIWPGMTIWSPADSKTAAALARETYETPGPKYLRLDRSGLPNLAQADTSWSLYRRSNARTVVIVSTGIMTHNALATGADVIDVVRLKPLDQEVVRELCRYEHVITLEEHLLAGGLGSIVIEALADLDDSAPLPSSLKRLGVPDTFTFDYDGREAIWKRYDLDVASVKEKIG